MNILFLTISEMENMDERHMYADLLRRFNESGHEIYIVCPIERRSKMKTKYYQDSGINILRVRIGNIKKCNIIEKGISTILLESIFINKIKHYLVNIKFDMIIYSTPPITFSNVIKFIKTRDNSRTYLLLRDIFPQNAVDLNMFSKKGIFYKYFRKKEQALYKLSDYIGCMSQANVDYVLRHNPEVEPDKIHINPNCIEIENAAYPEEEKQRIRLKYNLPSDKIIFVYGGNLGKPQGIPFIIDCLKTQQNNDKVHFLIIGSGTEYSKLEAYVNSEMPANVALMSSIPRNDYDVLITACDVGLIFLDHRFTIPNFPSRLLGYMQASLPVLACTDPNTDVGKVIVDGKFGWWCESNDIQGFKKIMEEILAHNNIKQMKHISKTYLINHYSIEKSYEKIVESTFI